MTAARRPYARFVSSAIFTASPASTVPISQRCTNSQIGRVPRNSAIEPAASAISALTLTLMAIWVESEHQRLRQHAALSRIDELRQQRQIQHRRPWD